MPDGTNDARGVRTVFALLVGVVFGAVLGTTVLGDITQGVVAGVVAGTIAALVFPAWIDHLSEKATELLEG